MISLFNVVLVFFEDKLFHGDAGICTLVALLFLAIVTIVTVMYRQPQTQLRLGFKVIVCH